jgi:hypothetical protein
MSSEQKASNILSARRRQPRGKSVSTGALDGVLWSLLSKVNSWGSTRGTWHDAPQ